MRIDFQKRRDPERESWYRLNRYLTAKSTEEVENRIGAIIGNLVDIRRDGRLAFRPAFQSAFEFENLLDDCGTELQLRGYQNTYSYPESSHIPRPTNPHTPLGYKLLDEFGPPKPPFLVRYMSQQHAGDLRKYGKVRLSPASSFKEYTALSAVGDNEIERSFSLPRHTVKLTLIEDGSPIRLLSDLKVAPQLATDYYLYCLSTIYSPRLLEDFGADCAVFIRDIQEFCGRLEKAFSDRFPNWVHGRDLVKYIDPVVGRSLKEEIDICFTKQLAYEYQREFRLVWLPDTLIDQLDYAFLELGSLEDIVDLWRI